MTRTNDLQLTVWTIGHSTRAIEEFVSLVEINGIQTIADVRRFPASRRYPQFNEQALRDELAKHDIDYVWLPSLGGRRSPLKDSVNDAWRNEGFRGYADHIATEEFAGGLFDLVMIAGGSRTAIMCAEAVWWQCHRSLISDVLRSTGYDVIHIVDAKHTNPHPFTSPARIVGGVLTYSKAD